MKKAFFFLKDLLMIMATTLIKGSIRKMWIYTVNVIPHIYKPNFSVEWRNWAFLVILVKYRIAVLQ